MLDAPSVVEVRLQPGVGAVDASAQIGAGCRIEAGAVIEAEAPRRLPIIAMTDGVIDPRVILGLNAKAEDDLAARPSHHDGADDHEHEDFDSVVIDLPEVDDPEVLVAGLDRMSASLARFAT